MEELKAVEGLPPLVLYCPVDGGPLDAETIAPFEGVARFVVYTEFGRRQVEAAVAARRREGTFDFPAVEVIPHGVDTETFHPLDGGRQRARRLLFPEAPDVDERFIVLNANRNQPRKRIDTTIRGFALFARDKPLHVKLFLHMGVEDAGWNVIRLARRYGVEDRVLMSSLARIVQGVSTKQLNLVYNACDVGLNTSSAEGWGLPSFEHAATRAAQIVPRHSACEELWRDSALLLDPTLSVVNDKILTEAWLVSPESVAEALERLYRDRELLAELSELAYRNAKRPEYRWETISAQWDAVFREVLAEPSSPRR
jgi:D-inositol-3-phosphate glycosyltransferase